MTKPNENNMDKNIAKSVKSQDKRYLPRWEVKNRILCVPEKDAPVQECESRDISSLGACLSTQENIPIDQKIKLKIYLTEKRSFDVDARIKWKKTTAEGYSIGVIFEDVTPEIQELILSYAFEVKRDDVVRHWFRGWEGKKD
jgi:hypothetical protein